MIEKDGGCAIMDCPCGFSMCWTCGMDADNWFHEVQADGFLCQCMNAFIFGFEDEIGLHWTIRVLGCLIVIALVPFVLPFVFAIVTYT